MKKDDCIFCKIAAGEISSATVYEDDDFRAILDLGPAAKGHTLVIPKSHSDNLLSVEPDTAAKALKVISKTANAIKEALGCDGINVVQNNGEAAGQTVMHLHFHIIPRYKNDSVNIGWQPMKPSNEELAATADLIKEKMN
ncbi:MAG TPA: HIT family protein [Eubacterium sp.]|jgi:histidine triad (HIT) family protein|nr:HIT family protein [Eubacterium sp.]HAX58645.1 HIT family protein [Eubacterium sp.]HAZ85462.1 HIT family protein [Eubacterium sp.]